MAIKSGLQYRKNSQFPARESSSIPSIDPRRYKPQDIGVKTSTTTPLQNQRFTS